MISLVQKRIAFTFEEKQISFSELIISKLQDNFSWKISFCCCSELMT